MMPCLMGASWHYFSLTERFAPIHEKRKKAWCKEIMTGMLSLESSISSITSSIIGTSTTEATAADCTWWHFIIWTTSILIYPRDQKMNGNYTVILPIVCILWVSMSVLAPILAAALAASHPAWPPPTTMTSYDASSQRCSSLMPSVKGLENIRHCRGKVLLMTCLLWLEHLSSWSEVRLQCCMMKMCRT